ncbi:rCG49940 [Rattus norvegicus]|uniref:RCG49940 n=1 Tax=Rattus norvegicus TaxID=10116 RepID=A6MGV1_RAT|nr:rCG49940 [Rattus norvegicus]
MLLANLPRKETSREEGSPERLPDHCKHFSKGLKELNEKTPLLPKTSESQTGRFVQPAVKLSTPIRKG